MEYVRVPVEAEVVFSKSGSMRPKKLYYEDEVFEVDRLLRVRKYNPAYVRCIAPEEYTVVIDGKRGKVYYEADSNTWFTIKEIQK